MKNTNLKQFLDMKEKELEDLQTLHVTAVASKSTIVYQKYSYTARALRRPNAKNKEPDSRCI